MVNILRLSEVEANCDIRHSPDHLRVICSLSGVGTKNEEPRNVILKHFELKEGTLKENTEKAIKLNLERYGVQHDDYKFGDTWFFPGAINKAIIVNNHENDLSILEIELKGVDNNLGMSVSKKTSIKKIGNDLSVYDIEICPTFSSLFIFIRNHGQVYGVNVDLPSHSHLTVPLHGENREVIEMKCSNYQESFQLVVKDKITEQTFLLTYYGFDGT